MAPQLTTTSYAILGLLALRPWTTYELAQQMDRALGKFWPRARSKIYEEPKKLADLGLARATAQSTGNRPRTVYSITAKGRRALAAWVPQPGEGPVFEIEQLVKVFFAEHGDRESLLATIAAMRQFVADRAVSGAAISRGYLDGVGPFPERLPWLILSGELLQRLDETIAGWAEWALDVVSSWPDDIRSATPDWDALASVAERCEQLADSAPRASAN